MEQVMGNKRHYGIRHFLGLYQKWFLELYGSKRFRHEIVTIENFFDSFPKKRYLSQFRREHIHDWAVERKRQGFAPSTIAIELSRVRKFWNWCIENHNLKVLDILVDTQRRLTKQHKTPKKKAFNSAWELKAVFDAIEDAEVKWFVLADLANKIPPGYKIPSRWRQVFRTASRSVGLDYSLGDLRSSIPKLRLWVFQNLHEQLGDALLSKAEFNSHAQTAINLPAFDVRPTVTNSSNDNSTVIGVN